MEKSSEEMIADFKVLMADMEALLKATADQGGEKLAEIHTKAEESLKAAKARIAEERGSLLVNSRAAAKATDVYVRENPWKTVGVAAGFSLIIGLLLGRR